MAVALEQVEELWLAEVDEELSVNRTSVQMAEELSLVQQGRVESLEKAEFGPEPQVPLIAVYS